MEPNTRGRAKGRARGRARGNAPSQAEGLTPRDAQTAGLPQPGQVRCVNVKTLS